MKLRNLFIIVLLAICQSAFSQDAIIDGYIYESKNRGYLNQVKVTILDDKTGTVKAESETDKSGHFTVNVPRNATYRIGASKEMFIPKYETLVVGDDEKAFAKIEMDRKPGYLMDITLAEKRTADLAPTDGLTGVKVEVYNNTTGQEIYHNDSTSSTNLQVHMDQGNHYTYLVRKKGYFTKRIEAYVNVKGCILCIDGIDQVTPGVVDNLTRGFLEGVLLANLELQPMRLGSSIKINNIFYDLGSASLRPESRKELDKLGLALKDNPYINVELSAHTDSRGDNLSNMNLSQRRAESVVDYLVRNSRIDGKRLVAQGYGETKLVNRCVDGIQCLEDEHQMNRRTELKILSIDETKVLDKSLVEMIRESNMEKTIQEVQKSDVLEVKDGEAMPDDLKKYIEEQNNKPKSNPAPEKPTSTKNENPRVDISKVKNNGKIDNKTKVSAEKVEEKQAVAVQAATEVKMEKEEIPAPAVTTKKVKVISEKEEIAKNRGSKVDKKAKVSAEKVIEKAAEKPAIAIQEVAEVKVEKEDIAESEVTTKKVKVISEKEEIVKTQNSKVVVEKPVKVVPTAKKIDEIGATFSAYSIELFGSSKPLPSSNEIFSKYDKILVSTGKNETTYYVGEFKKLKEAEDFFEKNVSARYPKAKIVRFVDGKKMK